MYTSTEIPASPGGSPGRSPGERLQGNMRRRVAHRKSALLVEVYVEYVENVEVDCCVAGAKGRVEFERDLLVPLVIHHDQIRSEPYVKIHMLALPIVRGGHVRDWNVTGALGPLCL